MVSFYFCDGSAKDTDQNELTRALESPLLAVSAKMPIGQLQDRYWFQKNLERHKKRVVTMKAETDSSAPKLPVDPRNDKRKVNRVARIFAFSKLEFVGGICTPAGTED